MLRIKTHKLSGQCGVERCNPCSPRRAPFKPIPAFLSSILSLLLTPQLTLFDGNLTAQTLQITRFYRGPDGLTDFLPGAYPIGPLVFWSLLFSSLALFGPLVSWFFGPLASGLSVLRFLREASITRQQVLVAQRLSRLVQPRPVSSSPPPPGPKMKNYQLQLPMTNSPLPRPSSPRYSPPVTGAALA
jgi:hypothetical protein